MATKEKKERKYSARESTGINLGTRITGIDPLEVRKLGGEADKNTDYGNPNEAEKTLARYGAAYAVTNGILKQVTGVGEVESREIMEEARMYLRAYAPSRIRNIDSNRP